MRSSSTNNYKIKLLKVGIFLFPLVFIFLVILDKILFGPRNDFYIDFAKEDGPVEVFTAVFYFLSFLFSVIIGVMFIKEKKNLFAILYLLLSIIFFLITFEEISWGQRIFMFETPEYFSDNTQHEMNFHNLPIFDDYKRYSILIIGLVGFILWAVVTRYDKLKNKLFTKFFVPQTFIMSYFVSVIIFYGIELFREYIPKSSKILFYLFLYPDHEVFEFLLSAGIFIFIVSKIIKLRVKDGKFNL